MYGHKIRVFYIKKKTLIKKLEYNYVSLYVIDKKLFSF